MGAVPARKILGFGKAVMAPFKGTQPESNFECWTRGGISMRPRLGLLPRPVPLRAPQAPEGPPLGSSSSFVLCLFPSQRIPKPSQMNILSDTLFSAHFFSCCPITRIDKHFLSGPLWGTTLSGDGVAVNGRDTRDGEVLSPWPPPGLSC